MEANNAPGRCRIQQQLPHLAYYTGVGVSEIIIVHMGKRKKMTAAQKAAKKIRQKEYMTIFVNGKQKRVKRPPTVDGMPVEDFILQNADPIWLHQNEMWEYIRADDDEDTT